MTVQDVSNAKIKLCNDINQLINSFEKSNDVVVKSIEKIQPVGDFVICPGYFSGCIITIDLLVY